MDCGQQRTRLAKRNTVMTAPKTPFSHVAPSLCLAALKTQYTMKPDRKQELAWKCVTKEDDYQKMLILLPQYLPTQEEDDYEAPEPRKFALW